MQTYLINTVYVGTASLDNTTNITRRLRELTGEMTARFKAIITAAGAAQ